METKDVTSVSKTLASSPFNSVNCRQQGNAGCSKIIWFLTGGGN